MIRFLIKSQPEVRKFIDEAHVWCNEKFGPRTSYRGTFPTYGRWEHNPEPYGTGSSVFFFYRPEDAIAFKLRFSDFVEDGIIN